MFDAILDQAVPVRLLSQMAAKDRIPHGVLFYGPEGVGKTLVARAFAQALVSAGLEGERAALALRKVEHGTHPDIKWIVPSGKTRGIGIDEVDGLRELAAFRPFEARRRVVILCDADRMRIDAQNQFLKTLEEPASKTVFVLISAAPRRLLPTIRSRCQPVRFGALREETVAQLLQRERGLDAAPATAIAAVSQGQMSRALALVDSEKRGRVIDAVTRLARGEDPMAVAAGFSAQLKHEADDIRASAQAIDDDTAESLDTKEAREALREEQAALGEALVRREIMEYLYLLQTWYRDRLILDTPSDDRHILNRDAKAALAEGAGGDPYKRLAAVDQAWRYIERNLNMDRVFRDLFFTLAG